MHTINDIYDLKDNLSMVLTIPKESYPIDEIYHEAYNEGLWLEIDYNPIHDCHVVKVLEVHKLTDISNQIINVLKYDDGYTPKVIYKGDLNIYSLRSTVLRKAKSTGINVKTENYDGYLICKLKTEFLDITEEQKRKLLNHDIVIDVEHEEDLPNIRAKLHYFASKNKLNLKTRYQDGKLSVRHKKEEQKKVKGNEIFVDWIKSIPFDVPLPVPEIKGLSAKSMDTIAKRNFGCMCLLDGFGKLTKHEFRLSKEKGLVTLRCRGEIKYLSDKSKKSDLEKWEWETIKNILKQYRVTLDRLA